MSGPYSFDEARSTLQAAAAAQIAAETFIKQAARDYAVAEEAYRIALAQEIVKQHDDGKAWTVCPDLARGQKHVAKLRRNRDIAEGVKDAAVHAAWRAAADRRTQEKLTEWSMRREIAEGYGHAPEPENVEPIGGRRAA